MASLDWNAFLPSLAQSQNVSTSSPGYQSSQNWMNQVMGSSSQPQGGQILPFMLGLGMMMQGQGQTSAAQPAQSQPTSGFSGARSTQPTSMQPVAQQGQPFPFLSGFNGFMGMMPHSSDAQQQQQPQGTDAQSHWWNSPGPRSYGGFMDAIGHMQSPYGNMSGMHLPSSYEHYMPSWYGGDAQQSNGWFQPHMNGGGF